MSFQSGPMSARSLPVLGGLSVAGLAALVAVGPAAHADTPGPAPTGPAGTTGSTTPAAPRAVKPAAAAVAPDYGTNKIRVGVERKQPGYYPAGTKTDGTTIDIVETGPNASANAALFGTSCQTVDDGSADANTTDATFCFFEPRIGAVALRQAMVKEGFPSSRVNRTMAQLAAAPQGIPFYPVPPGDSVSFTQATVNANLVIDPSTKSFPACVNPPVSTVRTVAAADTPPICPASAADALEALFVDPGLPPKAVDDHATTPFGTAVQVAALANDTTHGAPASITAVTQPAHGTATVRAAGGGAAPTITYTPAAGFTGVDTFRYTLHTANGDSSAKVTVTVTPPPPTAKDDSAATTSGASVTVHVTTNDSANGGSAITVESTTRPAHGTVRIDGLDVVYTAGDGFIGTDTFDYTISTASGTATATVTITVTAPLNTLPIASTGVPTPVMIELSLALLAVGGAAAHAGRRRARGRHAG